MIRIQEEALTDFMLHCCDMYVDRPKKITVNHSVTDILLLIVQTDSSYNTKYKFLLLRSHLPSYTPILS
jgi:hypothetical protein